MLSLSPPSERPRERCLAHGASTLSLRECLALILQPGLASRLLDIPGPGLSPVEQERALFIALESSDLWAGIPGMGDASRARLQAAFELGRRYAAFRSLRRESGPQRASLPEKVLRKIPLQARTEAREWLGFVPIHSSGPGELCRVETGVRTHVNVDPAELFGRILSLRPRGFFLFHNHPSGELTPSGPDFDLTDRVQNVGRALGVPLLGHGIVTSESERWIPFTSGVI